MKRLTRGVSGVLPALGGCCLVAALCAGCGRPTFVIEPYLQNPSQTEITILWATSTLSQCTLRFGLGSQLDQQPAKVACRQIPTSQPTLVDYLYEARLTGLRPGTHYSYRVAAPGASAGGSFRTSPDKPEPFTFVVYGDSRTGVEVHTRLGLAIGAANPAFILHSGDLTGNGDYRQYPREFFGPLHGVLNNVPIWTVFGNHEGHGPAYKRLFDHPGGEPWYSFDYGNLHVAALDYGAGPTNRPRMLDWLDKDLAASKAEWKVVCYHVPSYDSSRRHSAWGREDVLPILRRNKVDLVVSGDSHGYQRFRPMFIPGQNDDHPITHMVAAGGGAGLHPVLSSPFTAAAEKKHHFVLMTVDGGTLTGRAIGVDGEELDRFTIAKTAGRFSAEYLATAFDERTFDRVRGSAAASLDAIYLPKLPEPGVPMRFSFPVTAGAEPLTLKLFPNADSIYAIEPLTVRCNANQTVQATVTLTANGPVKVGGNRALSPGISYECHYESGKEKGVINSGPFRVGPPPTSRPADDD
ncbi:MAG: metallophosphoesterase family protein [Phycisphaerae bacterium]|nr:metallophosphoesterase family protein [Phycisphaerae bacterium]